LSSYWAMKIRLWQEALSVPTAVTCAS